MNGPPKRTWALDGIGVKTFVICDAMMVILIMPHHVSLGSLVLDFVCRTTRRITKKENKATTRHRCDRGSIVEDVKERAHIPDTHIQGLQETLHTREAPWKVES